MLKGPYSTYHTWEDLKPIDIILIYYIHILSLLDIALHTTVATFSTP